MASIDDAANVLGEAFKAPADAFRLYGRIWQLETWLREMVYVELKSARGPSWTDDLKSVEAAMATEKRLIHMATRHDSPLAFMTLGDLWEIMKRASNWPFFEGYFPPKHILEARLVSELIQIRHRVAHSRIPHRDDLARVEQFLRDVDKSFRRFTTRCNQTWPIVPAEADRVASQFLRYDQYPWCEVEDKKWARLGRVERNAQYTMRIERSVRPWVGKEYGVPNPGVVYDVAIQATDARSMDYAEILSRTKLLHPRCIHICLEHMCNAIRLTVPSVHQPDEVIETIETFRECVVRYIRPFRSDSDLAEKIAAEWPEYVLPPSNPLTFLCPDMPCTFFDA
jgi:hypothetical protein